MVISGGGGYLYRPSPSFKRGGGGGDASPHPPGFTPLEPGLVHVVNNFLNNFIQLYTTHLQYMRLESKINILFDFLMLKRFEHVYGKALYKYQYVCIYCM